MKLGKPFLTIQCPGGYTKTLEVIENIGLNTLQTGLGCFDAVSVVKCYNKVVTEVANKI